jgi:ABC-type antimicrobial peptide transport system permease subunit
MALGSTVVRAMLQVGRSGALASLAGLAAGLVLSAAALRLMRTVLYGVSVYDAATLAAVILTLATVTLVATALPALRIAKIDPASTLREE